MSASTWIAPALVVVACGSPPVLYPDREPMTQDPDTRPFAKMPREYESPFIWDKIDNLVFERFSRGLNVEVSAEAVNVNSLDEVPDSSWFVNRREQDLATLGRGGCKPDDRLVGDQGTGTWLVDKGKDNGSTLGFRIEIEGHGKYLLKADELHAPERASAASVIGAALYEALGFRSTCEQVVYFRPEQLKLAPNLTVTTNLGVTSAFDDAKLKSILDSLPHRGALVRMQASRWLEQPVLGPFRYEGTRPDDPNDVVPHEDRRELRGGRVLAAWLNHWDSREQNTLDIWIATNPKEAKKSPGYVEHHIIDTSDTLGQHALPDTLERRLGFSYVVDWRDIGMDFVTLGLRVSPWDRAKVDPHVSRFGYFSARDFDPAGWKGAYPNPAFIRMTERDAAWMARRIARLGTPEIDAIVKSAQLSEPRDEAYIEATLIERQRRIFARYLTVLSPLTDVTVHADGRVCALDLARQRGVYPEARFHYRAEQATPGGRTALAVEPGPDGVLCTGPIARTDHAIRIRIWNGTSAGPLDVYGYPRPDQPFQLVALRRPQS